MAKGGGRTDGQTDRRTDGRTDGRLEIPPCVLQDIGPLEPLPKKECRWKAFSQNGCDKITLLFNLLIKHKKSVRKSVKLTDFALFLKWQQK